MPNIEELLRKAMEEGKFDNLPGKGKPLDLGETNPHADPGWELAFKMLKDAGFSLPWIETLREIEQDIEAARHDLRLAWEWHKRENPQSTSGGNIAPAWERAQQTFGERLIEINKRIRDFNLHAPAARFQRPALNYAREVQKITSQKE